MLWERTRWWALGAIGKRGAAMQGGGAGRQELNGSLLKMKKLSRGGCGRE